MFDPNLIRQLLLGVPKMHFVNFSQKLKFFLSLVIYEWVSSDELQHCPIWHFSLSNFLGPWIIFLIAFLCLDPSFSYHVLHSLRAMKIPNYFWIVKSGWQKLQRNFLNEKWRQASLTSMEKLCSSPDMLTNLDPLNNSSMNNQMNWWLL